MVHSTYRVRGEVDRRTRMKAAHIGIDIKGDGECIDEIMVKPTKQEEENLKFFIAKGVAEKVAAHWNVGSPDYKAALAKMNASSRKQMENAMAENSKAAREAAFEKMVRSASEAEKAELLELLRNDRQSGGNSSCKTEVDLEVEGVPVPLAKGALDLLITSQGGGARRGRKASRKGRKASRKSRKASRKENAQMGGKRRTRRSKSIFAGLKKTLKSIFA